MKVLKSIYTLNLLRGEKTIANYMQQFEYRCRSMKGNHFSAITRFLSFIKTNCIQTKGKVIIGEAEIMMWMLWVTRGVTMERIAKIYSSVERFLAELVKTDIISGNPLTEIKTCFGKRGWEGIAWAFQSDNPRAQLALLVVEPLFKGDFGKQAQSYIALHRSAGKKYRYPERLLVEFNRFINDRSVYSSKSITPKIINEWLATMTCNQRSRRKKLCAMKLFFEHLSNLGIIEQNPVTTQIINSVRPRQYSFKPHIYSKDEIKALLREARKVPCNGSFKLKPQVFAVAITMLYTLGLRIGEIVRLRIQDVNMQQGTIFICNTKFYKDRIVPFGPELQKLLQQYIDLRYRILAPVQIGDALFVANRHTKINGDTIRSGFKKLFRGAGIDYTKEKYKPRIHDLRHTFAVHRLLQWYREGVDIQSKLILLSTFMGHISIYSTQLYLTITAELLQEANNRFYKTFEPYFKKETDHEA